MDLFPTVQMIQEVSMEFAVPALIEELASKNNCMVHSFLIWLAIAKEQHGDTSEQSHSSCELHSPNHTKSPGHHRWTPLDNYNKTYNDLLQHRAQQPCVRDHIHSNIVSEILVLTSKEILILCQLKPKALAEASSWKKRRSRSFSDDPRLRRMFKNVSSCVIWWLNLFP